MESEKGELSAYVYTIPPALMQKIQDQADREKISCVEVITKALETHLDTVTKVDQIIENLILDELEKSVKDLRRIKQAA